MRPPYAPDASSWLVLRAALASPDVAAQAWREWRLTHEIDDAPPVIVRLLPLVSRNLPPGAVDAAEAARLAGIFRQSWYTNQLRMSRVAPLLAELAAADLPVMVFKGASVVAAVPGATGVRPMIDADVLARPDDVPTVTEFLFGRGFTGKMPAPDTWILRHGFDLATADALIDLHWQPTSKVVDTTPLWADARQVQVQGFPVTVPSTVDVVLLACIHAMGPEPTHLQWIADVALVLRQAPEFDWTRLVARANDWGFVPEVRDALGVIATEPSLSALVPGAVLADLAALPTTAYDEFMHRAVTSWRAQILARRMHYWYLYRCWALANGRRPSLRHFGRLTRDLTERDDLIAYFLWRRRRVKREQFGVA